MSVNRLFSEHEHAALAAVVTVLRREAHALKADASASNVVRPMFKELARNLERLGRAC